ncbi:acetyltransferase [Enorma massiliensis]|uniref:acetyltransferase n=1 Tax=Enorma massiliensis TaxID=1472761 RepID=UPI002E7868D9|nr:acetyltransferase [Enorma massiliensis]
MNRLIIIGASGHGKVVADIAKLSGYTDIAFLDDAPGLKVVSGYPVLGAVSTFSAFSQDDFFVAIGNSDIRRRIQDEISSSGARLVTLIHPSAVVAQDVVIGEGTAVMAGAVINPSVRIGRGCIVNTSSSVDHDCVVGDYVHVSVGTRLAGSVCIGSGSWIGIGAVVSNNLSVCPNTMIGAGAVVVRNIELPGTYIGIPAEQIQVAS